MHTDTRALERATAPASHAERRAAPRAATEPPAISRLIAALRKDATFMGSVEAWRTVPARAASFAPFPAELDEGIRAALSGRGIEALYSHQAAATRHVLAGRNVVVVTPTASGKTLCYNLPVLQALRRNPSARALYLFPTKALSQDQVAELSELIRETGDTFQTCTYDGDTPRAARRALREGGHVVVTNPYMLHGGILPNHPRWAELFQNLTHVVIDELHTYRGVFGSHVANVVRRLRRICAHYGSRPVFVCASATIGNPRELAERLCEVPFELVERSGAPHGERHYALYNPPVVHAELGLRRAATEEVRRVLRRILPYPVQAIVFARSRSQVEVLTKYAKDAARAVGVDPSLVVGYRGGYLARLRRRIERGLRRGEIRLVVATNALELGVDIGALDVCVLTGYPGSVASFFQQTGRAGRRGRPALSILVARSSPMDQYLLRHPDVLLDAERESTVIDPDNLLIKVNHVKCSAFEVPFCLGPTARSARCLRASGEEPVSAGPTARFARCLRASGEERSRAGDPLSFGDAPCGTGGEPFGGARFSGGEDPAGFAGGEDPAAPAIHALEGGPRASETRQILDYLATEAGLLHRVGEAYYWMAEAYPAQDVSLTAADIDAFVVYDVEERQVMAEVDRPSAMTEIYEGAIYGFQGEQYIIERLDYPNRRAYARRVSCDYYTESDLDRTIRPLEVDRERRGRVATVRQGLVEVTTTARVYKKIKFYTRENVGAGEIHLPPEVIDTTATWLTIGEETAAELGLLRTHARALLGLRTLFRNVLPLFIRCDGRDLGVWSETRSPAWQDQPTIYLFDRMPAGVGLAERAYACLPQALGAMASLLDGCRCRGGCPSCVGLEGVVGPGARTVCRALLEKLRAGAG